MSFKKTNRTIHKWASIVIAIPLLIIFVTGILLLVKKEFHVLQPPTMKGHGQVPTIIFNQILTIAKTIKNAEIKSWQDIDRLDVRPSKGIIKVRTKNNLEIQLDASSGKVLYVAQRNSDLIESIHDGTFLEKNANLWLMLPVAIASIVILITGVILFFIPYLKKNRPRA
ncbi:hypothetical protein NBRC116592_03070 [Colwellia sp. KU-HH00111]|uniref:PepSY-associated TM helix domain-containing protein n=1 Tax=Colwellia sp. KU-HH00111 TaxID=3127652 RepID=UPI00310C565D